MTGFMGTSSEDLRARGRADRQHSSLARCKTGLVTCDNETSAWWLLSTSPCPEASGLVAGTRFLRDLLGLRLWAKETSVQGVSGRVSVRGQ